MNGEEKKEKKLLASLKSDGAILFFSSYMPPLRVVMQDGSVHVVKYSELDERLEELKQTRKERKRHV